MIDSGKVRWTILKRGCMYYFEDAQAKASKGEFSLAGYDRSDQTLIVCIAYMFKYISCY